MPDTPQKAEDRSDDEHNICPYCGHSHHVEAEDYSENLTEFQCDGCGKSYWLSQTFTVTHDTRGDCELNNEEHDFSDSHGPCEICVKCDKYRIRQP